MNVMGSVLSSPGREGRSVTHVAFTLGLERIPAPQPLPCSCVQGVEQGRGWGAGILDPKTESEGRQEGGVLRPEEGSDVLPRAEPVSQESWDPPWEAVLLRWLGGQGHF